MEPSPFLSQIFLKKSLTTGAIFSMDSIALSTKEKIYKGLT
jgi:hypothetical protein